MRISVPPCLTVAHSKRYSTARLVIGVAARHWKQLRQAWSKIRAVSPVTGLLSALDFRRSAKRSRLHLVLAEAQRRHVAGRSSSERECLGRRVSKDVGSREGQACEEGNHLRVVASNDKCRCEGEDHEGIVQIERLLQLACAFAIILVRHSKRIKSAYRFRSHNRRLPRPRSPLGNHRRSRCRNSDGRPTEFVTGGVRGSGRRCNLCDSLRVCRPGT